MNRALSLIFGICVWVLVPNPAVAAEIMGFRTWKAMRVEEAATALQRIQAESYAERSIPSLSSMNFQPAPGFAFPAPGTVKKGRPSAGAAAAMRVQKGGKGESRLQQAQLNLEVATELTINDYFVLYLSQFDSETAMREAAKKLSPDEVAELMIAFRRQLQLPRADTRAAASNGFRGL